MGTIKIGSSANRKGITVDPSTVLFNGLSVKKIMSGATTIWQGFIAWFANGVLSNTDVFGTFSFVKEGGGTNNSDSYSSDGYISLGYSSASGKGSKFYSTNKIPRGVYQKIRVSFVLSGAYSNYGFAYGLTSSNTTTSASFDSVTYKTSFAKTASEDMQEVELDLTTYNNSSSDLYFVGGGASNVKIYKIEFLPI